LRVVLGDQLSRGIAALRDLDPAQDVVLLAEVRAECTYVRHHQQKIVLVLSAMRHFAASLRAEGVRVAYVRLDDPANTQTLRGEIVRAVARYGASAVVATEPGEWRVQQDMQGWQDAAGVPVEIVADTRFFISRRDFAAWAGGRQSLRMEFFYRDMRRRTGLLMQGDQPAGGKWNFDKENRKRLPKQVVPPPMAGFAPDATTREVIALVAASFGDHFGALPPAAAVRRLAGCHAVRRGHGLSRAACRGPEFGAARSAGRVPDGGGGVARGAREAQCGRGIYQADPGLARIRARHILAAHAGLWAA
jgi:deoxyribodipyrimidine photolyase-related protein